MAVRLYVGGIPVGITPQELEDRFLPFGSVVQCEIIPPKTHSIILHGADRQTVSYPRNFGYVSLLPKDERSLQRAMSCYNGTRWRGSVMRCQVAKPTMMDTIAAEKAQMPEDEATDEAGRSQKDSVHLIPYHLQNVPMIEPGSTLRLRKPYTRHLVTVKFEGNKSNTINLEGGRDEAETLALVKEAARKRSYEEHLRSLRKEKEKMGGALLDNPGPMGMNHPTVKKTHHQVEKSNFRSVDKPTRYLFKSLAEMGDGLGAYPASAINSKIVSFMSGEEVEASQGGRRHVDIDLSRFNSDSEDERGTGVSNIPQVDGGNDEESSNGGSMEETDGISDIDASSPLPEEAIHKSSSESDSATDSATDSKDDSVTDSEAAPTDAVNDSIPGWLSESFPEGAFFYRQEPLHQLEATWRATKDGELQECKERRRQALRHSRGSRNGFLGKRKHTK